MWSSFTRKQITSGSTPPPASAGTSAGSRSSSQTSCFSSFMFPSCSGASCVSSSVVSKMPVLPAEAASSKLFCVPKCCSLSSEHLELYLQFARQVYLIREQHWNQLSESDQSRRGISCASTGKIPLRYSKSSIMKANDPNNVVDSLTQFNNVGNDLATYDGKGPEESDEIACKLRLADLCENAPSFTGSCSVENFLPDVYSPYRLIRFLEGYQYNVAQTTNAFITHLNWRLANKVDLFMTDYIFLTMIPKVDDTTPGNKDINHERVYLRPEDAPGHAKVVKYFPVNVLLRDTDGSIILDKSGNVIGVERPGLLDEKRLTGEVSNDEFLTWHTYQLEFRSKLLHRLSVENNRLVKAVLILDLAGLSGRCINSKTIGLLRQSVQVASENYPEGIAQIFFVNTPKIFAAVWTTMKAWMTQRTLSKIALLDNDYEKTLFEHVDRESLPQFLGGTCASPLADVPQSGLLLEDKFGLGLDKKSLTVGPRKKETVAVEVTEGTQLCWSWGVEENDIGFSIKLRPANKATSEKDRYIQTVQRYDSSKTVRGSLMSDAKGLVIFSWDNSWGLLYSRTIHYKIEDVSEIDAEALNKNAQEASASGNGISSSDT